MLEGSVQDGGMDGDEFYGRAIQPDFPDEMVFQIRVGNPDNKGTFSKDGILDTVDLMGKFILARVIGTWEKTGKPPRVMNVALKIKWENDDNIAEGFLPYFDADITGESLTQIDTTHRKPLDS
jgi:hypothetical protein